MKQLRRLWTKIINIGVDISESAIIVSKIRSSNIITAIYQFVYFFNLLAALLYYHRLPYYSLLAIAGLNLVYFLNHHRCNLSSRLILIFFPYLIHIHEQALWAGKTGAIDFTMGQDEIVMLIAVFILFDTAEFRSLIFIVSLYFALSVLFPFYYQFLPMVGDKKLEFQWPLVITTCYNFLLCGLTIYSLSLQLIKAQKKSETLLERSLRKNKLLEKSQNEVITKNEEIFNANFELDKFLYSASHDLRSPVVTIRGIVNLVRIDKTGNNERYYEMIEACVEKLDKVIRRIIDHAQVTRKNIEVKPVNLEDAINKYRRLFPELQILVYNRSEHCQFYCDESFIHILMENMISNAHSFRNFNHQISHLMIEISCTYETCNFVFIDNGIGIPANRIDKIFNMFYRAHDFSVGSGLGLYIVKSLVHRLGGRISVESKEFAGTTFQIMVPNLFLPELDQSQLQTDLVLSVNSERSKRVVNELFPAM
jgi:signal transduction histidine kinase